MKIVIVKNSKDVGAKAAWLVVKEIIKKRDLVLGLATGGTMIPFYRSLIDLIKGKKIELINVRTFNLDEYVGLSREDRRSYYYSMKKNFFSKVAMLEKNINFLDGMARNLDLECENYEKKIEDAGGIDLQILGIGRNGHIGFNEPWSSFRSRTREVFLSDFTRKDNSRFFSSLSKVPKRALTMGIATIMSARKIILLASGKSKAGIVHRALHGRISEDVPASVLYKHHNIIFVSDKGSASELD